MGGNRLKRALPYNVLMGWIGGELTHITMARKVPNSQAYNNLSHTHVLLPPSILPSLLQQYHTRFSFIPRLEISSPVTLGNRNHHQIWLPLLLRHSIPTTLQANVVEYQGTYTTSCLTIIIFSVCMVSSDRFPAPGSATMSP